MWLSPEQAANLLRQGGLIAYPTEAVFGLGCDPANEAAVMRLLSLKQRPQSKGLILLAGNSAQLQDWVDASDVEWRQMQAHWPGPVTFLVKPSSRVPSWIKGEHPTVAVRVCGLPIARQLALAAGFPLVSTSANFSGDPAYRQAEPLADAMGSRLDGILGGECDLAARPSKIIDLASGKLVRE